MFKQLALQWLKSNGYSTNEDLYFIRRSSKFNFPRTGVLIKKNTIFEIYWAETKPGVKEKKVKKVKIESI